MVAGLQNLKDGEDAHDGVIHDNFIIYHKYDRGCRELPLESKSAQMGQEVIRDGDRNNAGEYAVGGRLAEELAGTQKVDAQND
jgi:hypothetical protein